MYHILRRTESEYKYYSTIINVINIVLFINSNILYHHHQ